MEPSDTKMFTEEICRIEPRTTNSKNQMIAGIPTWFTVVNTIAISSSSYVQTFVSF
jgi:hypothetical protein